MAERSYGRRDAAAFPSDIRPGHEPEYTVQQAAELTGLGEHTLRYYERIGLLNSIRRDTSSGHRRYSAQDLHRMEHMACLRATGMPIDLMRRYFELVPEGPAAAPELLTLLEEYRPVLEDRIRQMQSHMEYLQRKIAYWQSVDAQNAEAARAIGQELWHEIHGDTCAPDEAAS